MESKKLDINQLLKSGDVDSLLSLLDVDLLKRNVRIVKALSLLQDPRIAGKLEEYQRTLQLLDTETTMAVALHHTTSEAKPSTNPEVVKKEEKISTDIASDDQVDEEDQEILPAYKRIPERLSKLIATKGKLPPIPETIIKLDKQLRSRDTDIKEIAKMISTDPVITVKIISVANSAYYSAGRVSVKDLSMAIGRLGLSQISNIVLSFSIIQQFVDNKLLNRSKFWLHSIAVSYCAHALAVIKKLSMEERDKAYVAGMMHDIGIQVLGYIAPDSYSHLLQKLVGDQKTDPDFNLVNAEFAAYKTDHAAVGAAYVKQWWPVEEDVVDIIADHHSSPFNFSSSTISKIINIANRYCNATGYAIGINIDRDKSGFDDAIFEALELSEEEIDKFKMLAEKGLESAKHMLSL